MAREPYIDQGNPLAFDAPVSGTKVLGFKYLIQDDASSPWMVHFFEVSMDARLLNTYHKVIEHMFSSLQLWPIDETIDRQDVCHMLARYIRYQISS